MGEDSFMGLSVPDFSIPAFVMKLDQTATNVIWASHHNKGANGNGALTLNGDELALTNFCGGTNFTWGTQILNVNNNNDGPEVLFARFDKMSGECTSLVKIPGNVGFEDYGSALAVDASGDYIIGGAMGGQLTFDNGTAVSAGGQTDFFVAKYSTAVCSPLEVEEHSLIGLRISPNPVSDILSLNSNQPFNFFIVDLSGKILIKGQTEENSINVSSLDQGVYFLKLVNDQQENVFKFIKQ
jgi:hypothetical protein